MTLFILLLLFLLPCRVVAAEWQSYPGAQAIDGDTFRYGKERYRLRRYNAPELGQPGAEEAKDQLQKKLDSRKCEYKSVARDKYGRLVVEEKCANH